MRQAESISAFLIEALRSPDPAMSGRDVKVADVLDRAAEALDRDFTGSAATRGALSHALGSTYKELGLYREAVMRFEQARARARSRSASAIPTRSTAVRNLSRPTRVKGDLPMRSGSARKR